MSEQLVRIRVEFYGIVRARAGVATAVVRLPSSDATIGALIESLGNQFAELTECFDGQRLRAGFTASINGERFVTSPDTTVRHDEIVLIMSADAGG